MSYRARGFTDLINAETHGVTSVCTLFFPTAYPVGFNFITDNTPPYFSASSVDSAMVVYTAGANWGDIWTTITSYHASTVATVTSVQVDGSNNVIILATNSFVVGQQITFAVTTATFINGVTFTVTVAGGSGFTCAVSGFTYVAYGPTADTGTATGAAGVVVADNAVSDIFDNSNGKGYGYFGVNANTGGHPSFVDMVPNINSAIADAVDRGTGVYFPAGNYCYNSAIILGSGYYPGTNGPALASTVDPVGLLTYFLGAGIYTTSFIANNPASAAPQGFLHQGTLSSTSFKDFGVFGPSLPATASSQRQFPVWATQVVGTTLIVFAANTLSPGDTVGCLLQYNSWLNGWDLRVATASGTQFTVSLPVKAADGKTLTQGAYAQTQDNGYFATKFDAGAGPYWSECDFWGEDNVIQNVFLSDTWFTWGLHMRCTQGSIYNTNDGANSLIDLDGATVDGSTSNCMELCADAPGHYGVVGVAAFGGEGGIFREGGPINQSSAHGIGVLATLHYHGTGQTNPVWFENLNVSIGVSNNPPNVTIQVSDTVLIGCVADGGGTGYLIGNDTSGYHNYGSGNGNGVSSALFVTSEGQVPWIPSVVFALGQYVIDPAGHKQRVTAVTGDQKSGGSAPVWNDARSTTPDNHVTWQDDGVFTGTPARGIALHDCANNGTAAYAWWNAAYNAEATFTKGQGFVSVVSEFSTQSPIIQTGLTANLPSTVLYNVLSGEVQRLTVHYYVAITSTGSGNIVFTIGWTDPAGNAQTFTAPNLNQNSTSNYLQGSIEIAAGSAANVVMSSTGYNSSTYSVYAQAKEI